MNHEPDPITTIDDDVEGHGLRELALSGTVALGVLIPGGAAFADTGARPADTDRSPRCELSASTPGHPGGGTVDVPRETQDGGHVVDPTRRLIDPLRTVQAQRRWAPACQTDMHADVAP